MLALQTKIVVEEILSSMADEKAAETLSAPKIGKSKECFQQLKTEANLL